MNVIERLELERARLKQRLDDVESLLIQHRDLQTRAAQLLGDRAEDLVQPHRDLPSFSSQAPESAMGDDEPGGSRRPPESALASRDERRNVSPDVREFEKLVAKILTDAAKPMDRNELLAEVVRRGLNIPGKDASNTLGARMHRMPGATHVREGKLRGYWLESRLQELPGLFQ